MSSIDKADHRRQADPLEPGNSKRIRDEGVQVSFLSNGKTPDELRSTSP